MGIGIEIGAVGKTVGIGSDPSAERGRVVPSAEVEIAGFGVFSFAAEALRGEFEDLCSRSGNEPLGACDLRLAPTVPKGTACRDLRKSPMHGRKRILYCARSRAVLQLVGSLEAYSSLPPLSEEVTARVRPYCKLLICHIISFLNVLIFRVKSAIPLRAKSISVLCGKISFAFFKIEEYFFSISSKPDSALCFV